MLSNNKKEENPAIYNIYGPRGYYAMWGKSEKDNYSMIFLRCEI